MACVLPCSHEHPRLAGWCPYALDARHFRSQPGLAFMARQVGWAYGRCNICSTDTRGFADGCRSNKSYPWSDRVFRSGNAICQRQISGAAGQTRLGKQHEPQRQSIGLSSRNWVTCHPTLLSVNWHQKTYQTVPNHLTTVVSPTTRINGRA